MIWRHQAYLLAAARGASVSIAPVAKARAIANKKKDLV